MTAAMQPMPLLTDEIEIITNEIESEASTLLEPDLLDGDTLPVRPQSRGRGLALRLFFIRVLNYLTNYVVAYVPSYTFRHLWYRRVWGFELGRGVGMHMGTYVWSYGPRRPARTAHASAGTRGSIADARSTSAAA